MANGGFRLRLVMVCAVALAIGVPVGASSATPASPAAARSIIPVGTQGTNGPSTVTGAGSTGYVTVAPLTNFALPGYLASVNLVRKRVVWMIKVGRNPEGFALDSATGLGYVSNYDKRGTIRVVDLKRRKIVRTLPAGGNPLNLAVVRSGGRRLLIVVNNGSSGRVSSGSIDAWNLNPVRHLARIRVRFSPIGLASLGGDRMLVGSFTSRAARVLDLKKLKLVTKIAVPGGPVNDLAVGTQHIYITGLDGITVLDRRTLKSVGVVQPLLPADPLGVTVSGDTAYVVNNGAPGGVKPPSVGVGNSAPFPNGTLQILRGTRTLGSRKLGKDAQDVALASGGRKLLVNARLDGTVWLFPKP